MFFHKSVPEFDPVIIKMRDVKSRMKDFLSSHMGADPSYFPFFEELYSSDLAECYDEFLALQESPIKDSAKTLLLSMLHLKVSREHSVYHYFYQNTRQEIYRFGEMCTGETTQHRSKQVTFAIG